MVVVKWCNGLRSAVVALEKCNGCSIEVQWLQFTGAKVTLEYCNGCKKNKTMVAIEYTVCSRVVKWLH